MTLVRSAGWISTGAAPFPTWRNSTEYILEGVHCFSTRPGGDTALGGGRTRRAARNGIVLWGLLCNSWVCLRGSMVVAAARGTYDARSVLSAQLLALTRSSEGPGPAVARTQLHERPASDVKRHTGQSARFVTPTIAESHIRPRAPVLNSEGKLPRFVLASAAGLHCLAREPVAQPISKMAFEFDRRKLTLEDVRELIYREILEYHPQVGAPRCGGAACGYAVLGWACPG